MRLLLPAGLERLPPTPDRSGGCRARRSTTACAGRRRGARPPRRGAGSHCTAVAPVPMMPTRLSCRPVEVPVAVAAGVVVVPAAGVERVALERLDAGDAGQLRPVQRAVGHARRSGRACASPRLVRTIQRAASSSQRELGDLGLEAARCGRGRSARRSRGCARGSRARASTSPSGRSRSPRAAAGRCRTRRRTSRPGSGSSTRCRRSRRPSR